MTIIDILILLTLAAGIVSGFRRGVIGQVASITGIVAGFVACWLFGQEAIELLGLLWPSHVEWPSSQLTTSVVALAILFLLVYLTCRVVGFMLKGVSRKLKLSPLDSVAGGAAGAIVALLLVSMALDVAFLLRPQAGIYSRERLASDHVMVLTMMAAPLMLGADSVSLVVPSDTAATATVNQNVHSAPEQDAAR